LGQAKEKIAKEMRKESQRDHQRKKTFKVPRGKRIEPKKTFGI